MPDTSATIVNQALALIGQRQASLVTGLAPTFDSSPEGVAAAQVYAPAVRAVARQAGWDFARTTGVLSLSGNTAPQPWAYEYLYPASAVQIWQLYQPNPPDPNDPQPQRWVVGSTLVNGAVAKVIWSYIQNALAVWDGVTLEPTTWDPLFREAVVRLLANALAMALEGKPDTAQSMLENSGTFEAAGETRGES